jgi:hypothetical protein
MAQITESFYKQITTIIVIASAGYFLNKNITSTIKDVISPVVERLDVIEKKQGSFEFKQENITYKSKENSKSLNSVIDFLNKKFNREFVKPDEIYMKDKEDNGFNNN